MQSGTQMFADDSWRAVWFTARRRVLQQSANVDEARAVLKGEQSNWFMYRTHVIIPGEMLELLGQSRIQRDVAHPNRFHADFHLNEIYIKDFFRIYDVLTALKW